MLFRDRAEAGRLLARELIAAIPSLADERPLVFAIPRGGVPVAAPIAHALDALLDIFVARKIGAPGREELGIGAVAADGTRVLDDALIAMLDVSDEHIARVTQLELAEAKRRVALFRGARAPVSVRGRAVILVDDGLATGATARAALTVLGAQQPARLMFAAPVASEEGAASVAALGVRAVFTAIPRHFRGVGEWYERFDQTSDAEVLALLAAAEERAL